MELDILPEDPPGEASIEGFEVPPADGGAPPPASGLDDVSLEPLGGALAAGLPSTDLAPVFDVPVELVVEIGRTKMSIGETLSLGPGSVISLDKQTGEPVDLLVNGTPIARGEVIAVDEEFGIRLTEVLPPERRLDATAR